MEIEAGGMTMADLRESLNKKVQIYKRDMESRRVELRKLEDDETRYALMGPDVELSDGFDHTSTGLTKISCFWFSKLQNSQIFCDLSKITKKEWLIQPKHWIKLQIRSIKLLRF